MTSQPTRGGSMTSSQATTKPETPKPYIVLTTSPPSGHQGSAFHKFRGNTEINTQYQGNNTSGVMLVTKEGQKPYTKITSVKPDYTKITSVKPALKRQNFDILKIPNQHDEIERIRNELRRSSSVPSHNH